MFEVKYSNQALKFLKKTDKILQQRLLKKFEELQIDPFPGEVKTVVGYKEKIYRVRVGDYRILYEVDHGANILGIIKIDKRPRVY